MRPLPCGAATVRWFLDRGYLVVLPMRRGYGRSGGDWSEDPGSCASPDYAKLAREGAHDIAVATDYAENLPGVRPDRLLLVGWDTGGMATLAYAASPPGKGKDAPPPGARAVIMGAGYGASLIRGEGHVCRPDLLADAAGAFGATTRIPTLWIYSRQDRLYSPELAQDMASSFHAAGGRLTLEQPDGDPKGGHGVYSSDAGPALWGPSVDAFLSQ